MQYRNAFEARAKPRAALPAHPQCERNFGHQHDGGLAVRESILYGPHVNFCFPAAGNAMQELHSEFAEFKPRANGAEGMFLFWIQRVRGWSVADVEAVFGGIECFFPRPQFPLAQ